MFRRAIRDAATKGAKHKEITTKGTKKDVRTSEVAKQGFYQPAYDGSSGSANTGPSEQQAYQQVYTEATSRLLLPDAGLQPSTQASIGNAFGQVFGPRAFSTSSNSYYESREGEPSVPEADQGKQEFKERTWKLETDSTYATLRKAHPDDAPLMQPFYNKLSDQSILFRFGGKRSQEHVQHLQEACYNPDTLVVHNDDKKQIIGVGQLITLDSETADITVVAADRYQNSDGVGVKLLKESAKQAMKDGFVSFESSVHRDNKKLLGFYEKKLGAKLTYYGQNNPTVLVQFNVQLLKKFLEKK